MPRSPRVVAFHKPRGVVCSTVAEGGGVALPTALPEAFRGFFAVGRLDKDSEGLLLLCDDSRTAQRLMDPGGLGKEYLVTVEGFPSDEALGPMRAGGSVLDGRVLLPVGVERVGKAPRGGTRLRVVLHEGLNRQIRRQLRQAGFRVRRLVREGVGPIALGDLAPGAARELSPGEIETLLGALRSENPAACRSRSRASHPPRPGFPSPPPAPSGRIGKASGRRSPAR